MIVSLLLPLLLAQNYNTYGKTEAEILAMGPDKWEQFYTTKAGGESTLTMVDASSIYGVAMQDRNDKIMSAHPNPVAKKLRTELTSFATSCIDLSENLAGGGTIWQNYYANIGTDVEGVLYAYLGGPSKAQKHYVVSDVLKPLDKDAKAIKDAHADKTNTYLKYTDAEKTLREMRTEFKALVSTAKKLKREDSDRVLGFCVQYAATPTEEFGK